MTAPSADRPLPMLARVRDWLRAGGAELLTPSQCAILKDLAWSTRADGVTWGSRADLAELNHLTPSGVKQAIRGLVDAGLLERVGGGRGRVSARYRIILPGVSQQTPIDAIGVSQQTPIPGYTAGEHQGLGVSGQTPSDRIVVSGQPIGVSGQPIGVSGATPYHHRVTGDSNGDPDETTDDDDPDGAGAAPRRPGKVTTDPRAAAVEALVEHHHLDVDQATDFVARVLAKAPGPVANPTGYCLKAWESMHASRNGPRTPPAPAELPGGYTSLSAMGVAWFGDGSTR